MSLRFCAFVLGWLTLVAACGDDGGTTPGQSDPVLSKQSGDTQTAAAGETLPAPAVIRVTRDGAPLAGQSVTWTVSAGGGSVDPTTSTTGGDGQASTTWTLGGTPGGNVLTASVTGATGSPLTFTATGQDTSPPPSTAAVSVEDNFFDPSSTRVAAGGTVTWTWNGSVNHNVTFSTGPNSSTQSTGTFVRTFATAGSFAYQCTIHGSAMSGTVEVQ